MKNKKLHLQPEWILLMRYQKTLTGWNSEVDSKKYFIIGTFQEIKYRIGYHDLFNSEKGFMPNSEVILGDISIRLLNRNQLVIDKFVLGSLSSFTPENKLSNPISYKIDFSFDSIMKKNENIFLNSEAYKIHPFQSEALFGKSYSYQGASKFLLSFLSGPKLQIHSEFTNGYRWAPALFINLTYEFKNFKFGYMGGYYHFPFYFLISFLIIIARKKL